MSQKEVGGFIAQRGGGGEKKRGDLKEDLDIYDLPKSAKSARPETHGRKKKHRLCSNLD